MLRFVEETFDINKGRKKNFDYYETMEKKIEAQRDRFDVETSLFAVLDGKMLIGWMLIGWMLKR